MGSNPGVGEIFPTRSGWPRDPPSLLYKNRVSFPAVKRPGRGINHPPPPKSTAITPLSLWAFMACYGVNCTLTFLRSATNSTGLRQYVSVRQKFREEIPNLQILVEVLYTNNIHGSYSVGFIYYICSIQGLLAAHWPQVELPRRPDWQTFLRVCLDFPYYWEQGVFVTTFFLCWIVRRRQEGGVRYCSRLQYNLAWSLTDVEFFRH